MSDSRPEGEAGWWQASDGKWYPPSAIPAPPETAGAGSGDSPDELTPPTGGSGSSKRSTVLLAGLGLVALIALAAGAVVLLRGDSEPTEPGPRAIGIQISLLDSDVSGTYGSCYGTGGYDDFESGMDVKVTDQDGKLIGSGSMLSLEQLQEQYPKYSKTIIGETDLSEETSLLCGLGALVPIDGDAKFYEIEIGRRGKQSASKKELEKDGWEVKYSLG